MTVPAGRPFNHVSMFLNCSWLLDCAGDNKNFQASCSHWWKTCPCILTPHHVWAWFILHQCPSLLLNKFSWFSFDICQGLDSLLSLPYSNLSPLLREALWKISAFFFQLVEYFLIVKKLLDHCNFLFSANPSVCEVSLEKPTSESLLGFFCFVF